jgi:hypothetical protein
LGAILTGVVFDKCSTEEEKAFSSPEVLKAFRDRSIREVQALIRATRSLDEAVP